MLRKDQVKGMIPHIVIAPASYDLTNCLITPDYVCTGDIQADTDKIQELGEYITAHGGGRMYILEGEIVLGNATKYNVSSSAPCICATSGLKVIGAGQGKTILIMKNNIGKSSQVIRMGTTADSRQAHDIYFQDLTIDANQDNNINTAFTMMGIYFGADDTVTGYSQYIKFKNVTVQNARSYGWDFHSRTKRHVIENCNAINCGVYGSNDGHDTASGFQFAYVFDIVLRDCTVDGSTYGFIGSGYNQNITITNPKVLNCGNGFNGSGDAFSIRRGGTVISTTVGTGELGGSMDATQTQMNLVSLTDFRGTDVYNIPALIDSEFVRIIGVVNSNVVTILRGQYGTTAAAHAAGTPVYVKQESENINISDAVGARNQGYGIYCDSMRYSNINGIDLINSNAYSLSSSKYDIRFGTALANASYPINTGVEYSFVKGAKIFPTINPATGYGFPSYNVSLDTKTNHVSIKGMTSQRGATSYVQDNSTSPETNSTKVLTNIGYKDISLAGDNTWSLGNTFRAETTFKNTFTVIPLGANSDSPSIILKETQNNTLQTIRYRTDQDVYNSFGAGIDLHSANLAGDADRYASFFAGVVGNRTADARLFVYGTGTNTSAYNLLRHDGTDSLVTANAGKALLTTTDASVAVNLGADLEFANIPTSNPLGTSNAIYASSNPSDGTGLKIDSN